MKKTTKNITLVCLELKPHRKAMTRGEEILLDLVVEAMTRGWGFISDGRWERLLVLRTKYGEKG